MAGRDKFWLSVTTLYLDLLAVDIKSEKFAGRINAEAKSAACDGTKRFCFQDGYFWRFTLFRCFFTCTHQIINTIAVVTSSGKLSLHWPVVMRCQYITVDNVAFAFEVQSEKVSVFPTKFCFFSLWLHGIISILHFFICLCCCNLGGQSCAVQLYYGFQGAL